MSDHDQSAMTWYQKAQVAAPQRARRLAFLPQAREAHWAITAEAVGSEPAPLP